jgi:hypothetical protein
MDMNFTDSRSKLSGAAARFAAKPGLGFAVYFC